MVSINIVTILSCYLIVKGAYGLNFPFVKSPTVASSNSLQKNDIVTVIGASGNVGRLVIGRLSKLGKYKVRGVCRDKSKVEDFFEKSKIQWFDGNVRNRQSLLSGLKDTNALIICSGTTAFPTKAWDGGNTPSQIDNIGVKNILAAWKQVAKSPKRLILMSSTLVTRRTQFPGFILNGMKYFGSEGVLDAKAAGEAAVREAAADMKFNYSIIRPGQLIGGPYTNIFEPADLLQLDKNAAERAVKLTPGDTVFGDVLRSTLAEVIVQTLALPTWQESIRDFAVVNVKGNEPTEAELVSLLTSL